MMAPFYLVPNPRNRHLGVYDARVLWRGQERFVPVYEAEGGPLVGMSLLRGSRLTVEVEPGGDVVIEDLPGSEQ
jgi:hypothetical protein